MRRLWFSPTYLPSRYWLVALIGTCSGAGHLPCPMQFSLLSKTWNTGVGMLTYIKVVLTAIPQVHWSQSSCIVTSCHSAHFFGPPSRVEQLRISSWCIQAGVIALGDKAPLYVALLLPEVPGRPRSTLELIHGLYSLATAHRHLSPQLLSLPTAAAAKRGGRGPCLLTSDVTTPKGIYSAFTALH